MSTPLRQQLGDSGEQSAETFLLDRGLKLVMRNYRCRSGEIDLVMLDPNPTDAEVLVFTEVRLRGSGAHADSLDSVDQTKQQRLISAARHFLMEHPRFDNHPCRFDVVGLAPQDGRLVWVPDAFEIDSD